MMNCVAGVMMIAGEYAFPLRLFRYRSFATPHSLRGAGGRAVFLSSFFRCPIRGKEETMMAWRSCGPSPLISSRAVASRRRRRFPSIPSPRLPRALVPSNPSPVVYAYLVSPGRLVHCVSPFVSFLVPFCVLPDVPHAYRLSCGCAVLPSSSCRFPSCLVAIVILIASRQDNA